MQIDIKLKRDKFRTARGGHSRLLNLNCRSCGKFVLNYQKDGPGPIYRLYLDRIFGPIELVNLQYKNLKDIQSLKCKNCKKILGVVYVYKKETRKAFRVFSGSLVKE
jgi:hypothetical protein